MFVKTTIKKGKQYCSISEYDPISPQGIIDLTSQRMYVLAHAIIVRAVEDLRIDLATMAIFDEDTIQYKHAKGDAASIKRFFESEWYEQLADIEGKYIYNRVVKDRYSANPSRFYKEALKRAKIRYNNWKKKEEKNNGERS